MKLMREVCDPQWAATRRAVVGLQQAVQSRVDQHSNELTAGTIRTIRTTWVVVTLGLLISFASALVMQVQVAKVDMFKKQVDFRLSEKSLKSAKPALGVAKGGQRQRPLSLV